MTTEAAACRPVAALLPRVVVLGNPNTGKSSLFNSLTGLRQKVGNYPGVTVEQLVGRTRLEGLEVELVDLPGTYSLSAHSPDELVAVDVLSGRALDGQQPDAVLVVVDASNLRRNLFLVSQVSDLGLPVVIALNMVDLAKRRSVAVDSAELERRLGMPVIPTVATSGYGLEALRRALGDTLAGPPPAPRAALPEVRRAALGLRDELARHGVTTSVFETERALVDAGGAAELRLLSEGGGDLSSRLDEIRADLGGGRTLAALEAESRYAAVDRALSGVERRRRVTTWTDRIDRVVHHPVAGTFIFIAVMAVVFQAVFAWATPLMELIDGAMVLLSNLVASTLPAGAVASLVTDGAIAGVGSVLAFLPQILILFAFIILLEDTGYMARVAVLMDRLMRLCGLSGLSFIPMLSSFACAVPGIMAARTIRSRRDRIATILAAPFMTCSARLPVYALLIAALVPNHFYLGGLLSLHGLVLLGLYLLGISGGIGTAWLVKRTLLRGPAPPFLMELPPYRRPSLRSLALRLWDRGRAFVLRAGTVIFAISMVVWALAYFPRSPDVAAPFDASRDAARSDLAGESLEERLQEIGHQEAAEYLEQSFLGRTGHLIEPVFAPLGWDWKISAAVVAAFPAREVVIAVLGTIYAIGGDADDGSLINRLGAGEGPDGTSVLGLPAALGLLVFFAFCLQCAATLAVMRRETNSWRWPAAAWVYMTTLAWSGAWLTYRVATLVVG
ncbi:MAG: ferrous iron transport protein B [Thermoanaerobaculales bacterium]